jgi:hypothetical protein
MNLHQTLKEQLDSFITTNALPNLIIFGPSGSGKRVLVTEYINNIYKTPEQVALYVFTANCGYGKGITFIRDEVKHFAKTTISKLVKTVLLYNADKLTIDAQSAMRRCIEIFSKTTRFILVVENRDLLLKPILSRFNQIYVPFPLINNIQTNLYKQSHSSHAYFDKRQYYLNNQLHKLPKQFHLDKVFILSESLYNKGYSAIDIADYIKTKSINPLDKYKILLAFSNISKEFRSELFLIRMILLLYYFRSTVKIENMLLF